MTDRHVCICMCVHNISNRVNVPETCMGLLTLQMTEPNCVPCAVAKHWGNRPWRASYFQPPDIFFFFCIFCLHFKCYSLRKTPSHYSLHPPPAHQPTHSYFLALVFPHTGGTEPMKSFLNWADGSVVKSACPSQNPYRAALMKFRLRRPHALKYTQLHTGRHSLFKLEFLKIFLFCFVFCLEDSRSLMLKAFTIIT